MSDLIIDNYLIDAPIIDILKKVREELTNGKLSVIEQKNDYVRVTCPKHKNGLERHPSCSVYCGSGDLQYGWWHCLTCQESGDLVSFISECFESSKNYAKNWLLTNFGNTYVTTNIDLTPIELDNNIIKVDNSLDESILNEYSNYHPYMTKRKLTDEVIEKFELKYDPLSKSIVFPVRDTVGKLVALTRRSTEGKKFYIDRGFNKKNIYCLYNVLKENIKEVIVCESQINALTCWGYGKPAICLFGAGVTEEQINELNKTNIKHYILCFDGDAAGRKGAERFKKFIRRDVFVDDIIMPQNRDINDLTKEEFEQLISLQMESSIL